MKNLYKIENELYIISNTENVDENCWIITDGRLVQVSYLLSDEVAKGNKVILTTNKLLIKDGVQAIDDEFLEWFVKNPSCEEVLVTNLYGDFNPIKYEYKIIIPKEESNTVFVTTEQATRIFGAKKLNKMLKNHKQETLEEIARTKFPHKLFAKVDVTNKKREAFIKGYKLAQERSYSKALDLFISEINNEFNDQNWDYLEFIKERVINQLNEL